MRQIVGKLRRAVEDYEMIREGDRIAVGVSGGKDSLTLLCALARLRDFYPKKFELCAITLDMGMPGADFSGIEALCNRLEVPFILKHTQITRIVFDIRKEKNPCSLCATLRRGALHQTALDNGCKKVALGHHSDDVTETLLLSLFYEGRIGCFSPVTYLDRKDITLLRPFMYVTEREIVSAARRHELPVMHNPCPANGNTRRQRVKELLLQLDREEPGLKERVFGALQRSGIDGWKPSEVGKKR